MIKTIYRQTFFNHLKAGAFLIIYIATLVGTLLYLLHTGGTFEDKYGNNKVWLMVVTFGFLFIPPIYLHCEYTIINWGMQVTLEGNDLCVNKKNVIKRIPLDSIKEIILFKAKNYNSFFMTTPVIRYFYGRIVLINNESIILTCLLGTKIDKELFSILKAGIDQRPSVFNTVLRSWQD